MMRRGLIALSVVLAAASPLAGCGGDDDGGGETPSDVLDVRDGYWRLSTTAVLSGPAETCTGTETDVDTALVCEIDFSDSEGLPFDMTCDVESTPTTFTFNCGGSFMISPCTLLLTNVGSGTWSEIEVHLTSTVLYHVSGPDNPCLEYENPCTTLVTLDATWVSPDTAGVCTPGKGGTVSLKALASGIAAKAAGIR